MPLNLIILVPLILWLAILTFLYYKLISHYNAFTKGTQKPSLLNSLNDLLKATKKNDEEIKKTNDRLDQLIFRAKKDFKRFGFKRFNPFTDTGGDQSFILVLLDENNNGFVISSLHSRENTRIYAKKLMNGKSPDQVLSKEEQEVINEAIKT